MARIRTIKPEFFTSEDIVDLSPLARLLYIATWCEADREGRLVWKPRTMKLRYFPADDCDIDALARELVASGLVVPYGDGLAFIPSFSRHQHVNPRESQSSLPIPDASLTRDDASLPVSDAQVGREGKGKEGKEEEHSCTAPSATAPAVKQKPSSKTETENVPLPDEPIFLTIPLNNGKEFPVTEAQVAEFSSLYPAVDVPQTLRSIRAWAIANPSKRKTQSGAMRFVNAWLAKEQNRGGQVVALAPSPERRSFREVSL